MVRQPPKPVRILLITASVLVFAFEVWHVALGFLEPDIDRRPDVPALAQQKAALLPYYYHDPEEEAYYRHERMWASILSGARYGGHRTRGRRTATVRRNVPLRRRIESHPDYQFILRQDGPDEAREELIRRLRSECVLMECLLGGAGSELQGDESQWLAAVRNVLTELMAERRALPRQPPDENRRIAPTESDRSAVG